MKEFNGEVFGDVVKDGLVLVDFFATWCGPCKMIAPILESIKNEVQIIKVNIDEHRELAEEYGVMSIPTLILFKGSDEVKKYVGFLSKEELLEFIKNN